MISSIVSFKGYELLKRKKLYYNEDVCVAVDDPEGKGIHVLPLQGLMS